MYLCVSLHGYVPVCVCTVRSCVSTSTVRSGYRLKSSPDQDSMKVLYYIEKELAQFPSAKMAALKRKPAQTGPVTVICVAVRQRVCFCVCVQVFVICMVCFNYLTLVSM